MARARKTHRGRAGRENAPGRKLEVLVSKLETALAGTGATVKSPDLIADVDSGELREVDVAIRGKLGSASLLVIVECRDRSRAQTVQWIEELISKAASVRAQRAVAVSPNGFTSAAIRKAKQRGLELRTLTQLSAEQIREWFPYATLAVTKRIVVPNRFGFHFDGEAPNEETFPELAGGELSFISKVLRVGDDGELFSADDLYRSLAPRLEKVADQGAPARTILEQLDPRAPAPVSGTSPPVALTIEMRMPDLRLVLGGREAGRISTFELVIETCISFGTIAIGDGQGYSAVDGPVGPLAARYSTSHTTPLLPPNVELSIIPADQTFTLSGQGADGADVVIACATTKPETES